VPHSEHPPPWVVELDRDLAPKKEAFLLQKSARTFSQGRNYESTCPELENRKKFVETQMNGREVRFSSYRLVKLWKRLKSFPSLTLSPGKFGMGWRAIDSGASGFRGCWSPGSIQISPRTGSGVASPGVSGSPERSEQAALAGPERSVDSEGSRGADAGPPRTRHGRGAEQTSADSTG